MAKTEAVVAGEDHVVRLQEVVLPDMTPTRVRIKTLFSGVSCGTESDCISGRAVYMQRPFIAGYQSVGEVVETGAAVRSVRPGDLAFTRGGSLWGVRDMFGGSHARELVVEEAEVFAFARQNASLQTVAYAALAAVGAEGVLRMNPEPGRTMLVFGLGMLGQLAGKIGQLCGLRVVGVNRSAWKCDAAKALGIDAVCAPEGAAIAHAVQTLGYGRAAYAVDLTGNQKIFDLALEQLGPSGQLSLLGYYPDAFRVDFDICHSKQIAIHSPVGWGERIPQVIGWIEQGRLNIEPLLRHTVKPSGVTAFYRDLIENHTDYLGAIIDWRS